MNSSRNTGRALAAELQAAAPARNDVTPAAAGAAESMDGRDGWREPPALTLDAEGVIVDCSDLGEEFFGYARAELASQHVSRVLPQFASVELLQNGQPNPYFNFLCHIGHAFEVQPRAGAAFLCALSLVCLSNAGHTMLRLIAQPSPAVFA
ncbi:MAG TPA: hypothetical protein VKC56_03760 [Gallionellaceae bacterium]|nr:hypothetical protein [Gallionellaceae bacterium]